MIGWNDSPRRAVAVLSPRAREGAPVSMPLTWTQVRKELDPKRYTIRTVPALLGKSAAWAGYDEAARPLEDAIRRLDQGAVASSKSAERQAIAPLEDPRGLTNRLRRKKFSRLKVGGPFVDCCGIVGVPDRLGITYHSLPVPRPDAPERPCYKQGPSSF
jgi:hypothetical protein